jgi:hypothetical protein
VRIAISTLILIAALFAAAYAGSGDNSNERADLIIFARERNVVLARPDALERYWVTATIEEDNGGRPVSIASFLWAPDDRSVLYWLTKYVGDDFRARTPHHELWHMNIDGSSPRLLERDLTIPDGCQPYLPDLVRWTNDELAYEWISAPTCQRLPQSKSPDGSRAAYLGFGIDSAFICIGAPGAYRGPQQPEPGADCGPQSSSYPSWSTD